MSSRIDQSVLNSHELLSMRMLHVMDKTGEQRFPDHLAAQAGVAPVRREDVEQYAAGIHGQVARFLAKKVNGVGRSL